MTILLTLYLAGMPLALVTILWVLVGIGEETGRTWQRCRGWLRWCCSSCSGRCSWL